ncbi:MAG: hypothetical protein L0Z54_02315, partial [Thermoplasmata archaeon]|nr:hypothetical protein [Thermoplasmata archaeon]
GLALIFLTFFVPIRLALGRTVKVPLLVANLTVIWNIAAWLVLPLIAIRIEYSGSGAETCLAGSCAFVLFLMALPLAMCHARGISRWWWYRDAYSHNVRSTAPLKGRVPPVPPSELRTLLSGVILFFISLAMLIVIGLIVVLLILIGSSSLARSGIYFLPLMLLLLFAVALFKGAQHVMQELDVSRKRSRSAGWGGKSKPGSPARTQMAHPADPVLLALLLFLLIVAVPLAGSWWVASSSATDVLFVCFPIYILILMWVTLRDLHSRPRHDPPHHGQPPSTELGPWTEPLWGTRHRR